MSTTPSQNVAGILLPASHSTPAKQPKMNPRRDAFVRHYLETGNGTKSAIAAGYAEKSAAAAASRLLTNPEIKGAIDDALLRQAELSDLTATFVLEGIRAIADDGKAKDTDRLRAYELLGKHLKLWTEKVEVDVTNLAERIAEGRKRLDSLAQRESSN